MPELAQIAQLRATSKGAARDLFPTGGAPVNHLIHTFSPKELH